MSWTRPASTAPGEWGVRDAAAFLAGPQVSVVLVNERYHESMLLLKDALGLPSAHYRPHKVQSQKGHAYTQYDGLSASDKAIVDNATALDQKLYTRVLEIFEAQLDAYGRKRMVRDLAEFDLAQNDLDNECENDSIGSEHSACV